jgi:putative SOS response-associated peptidase YedK
MPAILPPADYDAWLSPETPAAEAKALLRPYEGEMIAYPVDKAVGSPKNDRPELVEPLAQS